MMQVISVCVSDIPKEKIRWYGKEKPLKGYIDLVVGERKEPDKNGRNLFVAISQTKEEREAKAQTIYVGNGKTVGQRQDATQKTESAPAAQAPTMAHGEYSDLQDLPF